MSSWSVNFTAALTLSLCSATLKVLSRAGPFLGLTILREELESEQSPCNDRYDHCTNGLPLLSEKRQYNAVQLNGSPSVGCL